MNKAEAEMREILAGMCFNTKPREMDRLLEASDGWRVPRLLEASDGWRVPAVLAIRAGLAYGDLRARQAEDAMRERCAKVADAKAEEWWTDNSEKHYRTASQEIASAIRSLKPETPNG